MEVAHIISVHRADAKFQRTFLRHVISQAEKIGYRDMSVVSDNDSINKKVMS